MIDADASGGGIDFGYLDDAAWNLDERDINAATEHFNVNSQNELTSSPLGTPVYDDNGNMTDDGQVDYEYNAENQLVFRGPIDLGSLYTLEITYVYDGLERLRKKIDDYFYDGTPYTTIETRYIYDGRLVIEERNGSNVPVAHYVRGVDLSGTIQGAGGIGGLLSREWGANTGYYHADAQGNVTAMINSSGTVNADYHYDSFGNILSQSGGWASSNPYRFSSKRIDYSGSQGIYYYGFRFYHSDLQRWINRDPLGEAGGINLYGFVGNNPLIWITGLRRDPKLRTDVPVYYLLDGGGRCSTLKKLPHDLTRRCDDRRCNIECPQFQRQPLEINATQVLVTR